MKLELNKNELAGALSALGKLVSRTSTIEAYRCVEIEAANYQLKFRTRGTDESIEFNMSVEVETPFRYVMNFDEFRNAVRGCKNKSIVFEWTGSVLLIDSEAKASVECELPVIPATPNDAHSEMLVSGFVDLLNTAAPLVNRNDYRKQLQGINLSKDGITVTNGKELLNIPIPLEVESMTIPFPLALIATKEQSDGVLRYWTNGTDVFFSVCVGNWMWIAKAVSGSYPNWKQIVPDHKSLQYEVEFGSEHLEPLQAFLKSIPDDPPYSGMELMRTADGMLKIASLKGVQTCIPAEFSENWKDYRLLVSRDILKRLVNEEHTHLECSEAHGPFIATGGLGKYIAMPLYQSKHEAKAEQQASTQTVTTAITHETTNVESTDKETTKMIDTNTPVVSAPVQTAAPNQEPVIEQLNPLDDLTASIEAFKSKLKAMFDESNALSRKVKEVALNQKQKERDFVLAKKAIERIRLASSF